MTADAEVRSARASCEVRTLCRGCDGDELQTVLEYGAVPLANALLGRSSSEEVWTYPLTLACCASCGLAQIRETVDASALFEDYAYFSSYSDTTIRHAAALVNDLIAARSLGPGSLVFEVASNDGYLLRHFLDASVPAVGVEPAANVAAVARENGIETHVAFFDRGVARGLVDQHGHADVLIANNVLAHVDELGDFLVAVRSVLRPNGIAVFEFPYVVDMVERCEFDTVYHEHLCYFSLTALAPAVEAAGLRVVAVERIAIHGGSLRVTIAHTGGESPRRSVAALLDEEQSSGVGAVGYFDGFAARARAVRNDLVVTLQRLRDEGARIAAYGAAAKGSTLLSFCGIGDELIDFVADRNPHKQGRFMPEGGIPIVGAGELARRQPDYALLLTWNFTEEILAQQASFRAAGGRFIVPVPEVHIR